MKILVIDQGTTLTKAFVLTDDGEFNCIGRLAHQQFYPGSGRIEQNAEELAGNIELLIDQALAQTSGIEGIALANQGETVVAWDRRTKKPLHPALVWQDQRTQTTLDELPLEVRARITAKTGLPVDAYFSASKLAWLLANVPEISDAVRSGYLGLGTSDVFFIDRLTSEYFTDVTTASRTSLMSLQTQEWDPDLCRTFGVPIELLPKIRPTTGVFGTVHRGGCEIPLTASVVDQQAALYGHDCRSKGDVKITFGTGSFALVNTGRTPVLDRPGMIPTVAWALSGEPTVYALEGGDYTAFAAVNWAIRLGLANDISDFRLPEGPSALERGLVFVPALAGLAAPHWDRAATGVWIGLRQDTTAEDMRCALLEGIALRAAEVVESLPTSGEKPICIDGGLSAIPGFARFLANALGRPVQLSKTPDTTALGAAQLGMLGLDHVLPEDRLGHDTLIAPTSSNSTIRQSRGTFAEALAFSRAFGRSREMASKISNRSA